MQNQGFDNMSGWNIIFRMSSLGRFCYFKIEIRSASQEILKYVCRKRCSLQWLCHVERNVCAWMCIDVNRASEAVIDMNHFFSGSFYGVVPCKECDWNNCSRTQSALNPTWPLKMETAEGHNHTLPNGYRMVLAWIPSQPSLSLMVSFRFLLLRPICLVNSIHLHTTYGCNHMQQQGFDYICEILWNRKIRKLQSSGAIWNNAFGSYALFLSPVSYLGRCIETPAANSKPTNKTKSC